MSIISFSSPFVPGWRCSLRERGYINMYGVDGRGKAYFLICFYCTTLGVRLVSRDTPLIFPFENVDAHH